VDRDLRPLLQRIEDGEIDPSYIVTHAMKLDDAPVGYETFKKKRDDCLKVVLKP
jgi:threonine dehydrogenase-like Zn-dependent dehydrogenase